MVKKLKRKRDIRPILAVPAFSNNDSVTFFCREEQIIIHNDEASIVQQIIENTNGYNSIDSIVSLTGIDAQIVDAIINDLYILGILVDSRELYLKFHEISSSPDCYSCNLTRQEVIAHLNSPRLPIKIGKRYDFIKDSTSDLSKSIMLRRSCRSFSKDKMHKDLICNICYHAYSISNHTVPSGGGLYPIKLYVLIEEEQIGLPIGYYEYDSEADSLVQFSYLVDIETLQYCFNDYELPFGSSVQIVIAADLNRESYKYSNRGYRLTLIEAGHVAQNICLYCSQKGIGSCELGGVLDEPMKKELELNDTVYPLLVIAIGKPSGSDREGLQDFLDQMIQDYVGDEKMIRSYGVKCWNTQASFFSSHCEYKDSFSYKSAGATATSQSLAITKALVEGYERHQSSIIRTDYLGKASEISAKWIDPYSIRPLTDNQILRAGLVKFSQEISISWTEGFYYNTREKVLVPSDLVYYGHDNDCRLLFADSSGVAAHRDYSTALNNALLELIERDAIMKSWYSKIAPPSISYTDMPVYVRKRIDYWHSLGRQVFVFDMQSDYAPTFQVVIVGDEYPCFVSGAAATISSANEAIIKALREAEYCLLSNIGQTEKTITPENVHSPEDHGRMYFLKENIDNISWLWSAKKFTTLPTTYPTLTNLVKKINPIVINITDSDSPLKVVRVLSQECIPISFGYKMDYYTHKSASNLPNTLSQHSIPHYFS